MIDADAPDPPGSMSRDGASNKSREKHRGTLTLGMDHNDNVESNGEPLNILTFPSELLVYILSFVTNVRDIVKLRYVSRRFRSVCEMPSLWREFIWPNLDIREERCVKNLLKLLGGHIERLIFPDHVIIPSKLVPMLQHCTNVIELSVPTSKLNCNQLEKVLKSMQKLQSLDIPWTSEVHPLLVLCCNYRGLKELTIRIARNDDLYQRSKFELSLDSWLDKWVTKGFQPQVLKIVVGRDIPLKTLVEHWLQLNPRSPTGHTGCLKVFSNLKVPMDFFPKLPDFQLQFGLSCTLPFVKPSKCGLLGIEKWNVLLTDSTYGGKVSHKAKIIMLSDDIRSNHFSTDITDLTFVTQFDASRCGVPLFWSPRTTSHGFS